MSAMKYDPAAPYMETDEKGNKGPREVKIEDQPGDIEEEEEEEDDGLQITLNTQSLSAVGTAAPAPAVPRQSGPSNASQTTSNASYSYTTGPPTSMNQMGGVNMQHGSNLQPISTLGSGQRLGAGQFTSISTVSSVTGPVKDPSQQSNPAIGGLLSQGEDSKYWSHLEVSAMENYPDKPWNREGSDVSDYFNYGFTENTWKAFRERQLQLRRENGTSSQIGVYQSNRIPNHNPAKKSGPGGLNVGSTQQRDGPGQRPGPRGIPPATLDLSSQSQNYDRNPSHGGDSYSRTDSESGGGGRSARPSHPRRGGRDPSGGDNRSDTNRYDQGRDHGRDHGRSTGRNDPGSRSGADYDRSSGRNDESRDRDEAARAYTGSRSRDREHHDREYNERDSGNAGGGSRSGNRGGDDRSDDRSTSRGSGGGGAGSSRKRERSPGGNTDNDDRRKRARR